MRIRSLVVFMALSFSALSFAGEAEVKWEGVDKYTDFEPANGHEERYQEKVKGQLAEHIQTLAKELPEGQKLTLTVTDVDLTGRLEPTFGRSTSNYVRIVREIDFPRIHFNYQLTDSSGQVIKKGQEKLKNMGFNYDSLASVKRRNDLYFEEEMLTRWFNETLREKS